MAAVDTFFTDVDPGRRVPMERILPRPELETFVAGYEGNPNKEARLRALAALLGSKIVQAQQEREQPPPAESRQVDYEDVQGLIYAEIPDWPAALAVWGQVVETYYLDPKDDVPNKRRVSALWNFGCALRSMNRHAESEEMFRRVMSIDAADPSVGRDSETYARNLDALMVAVGKQGRRDEARALYEELQTIIGHMDEADRTSFARDVERNWREIEEAYRG